MNEINEEQRKRLMDLFSMSDEEFYEQFLADVSLEELAAFLNEFSDFMEDGEEFELDAEEMLRKIREQVNE